MSTTEIITSPNDTASFLRERLRQALGGSWAVQFNRWRDNGDKMQKYAVVRGLGGPDQALIRKPIVSVVFIGGEEDLDGVAARAAEAFGKKLRELPNGGPDSKVRHAQASEPVDSSSEEGRPIAEVSVNLTLSL